MGSLKFLERKSLDLILGALVVIGKGRMGHTPELCQGRISRCWRIMEWPRTAEERAES